MNSKESPAKSAVFAKNLGKAYQMYAKPVQRLWDMILPGKKRYSEFWAVRNVYLDIPRAARSASSARTAPARAPS